MNIIELPMVEKYKKGLALDRWVEFIKNPRVVDMSDKEVKKAIEQWIAQGKKDNTLELAKKMKDQGLDIEMIQKITNLTKEEINNL